MIYTCPLCEKKVETPKHDCSKAPPRTPVQRVDRIQAEISGVAASYGVKNADQQFMRGIQERRPRSLSAGSEKWLRDIEAKVFGDDDQD